MREGHHVPFWSQTPKMAAAVVAGFIDDDPDYVAFPLRFVDGRHVAGRLDDTTKQQAASSTMEWRVLRGQSPLCPHLGTGGYGEVVAVHGFFTETPLAVKRAPVFEPEQWQEIVENAELGLKTAYRASLARGLDPTVNDAIAEVMITQHLARPGSAAAPFVAQYHGCMLDEPLRCVEKTMLDDDDEDEESVPHVNMWTEQLDGGDAVSLLDDVKRDNLADLEALIAQAMAGIVLLNDEGVTHCDLHASNLMLRRRPRGGDPAATTDALVGIALPKLKGGGAVVAIDFGLATMRRPDGDDEQQFGGAMTEKLGIDVSPGAAERGCDIDFRTLILDVAQTLPWLPRFLADAVAAGGGASVRFLDAAMRLGLETGSAGGKPGEVRFLHTLFRDVTKLRRVSKHLGVKTKDENKNPYTHAGRYHLVRELCFREGPRITKTVVSRDDLVALLRAHYGG